MKWLSVCCLAFLSIVTAPTAGAQSRKAQEERERLLEKPESIFDRALGIHSRSNIGHSFENRGKQYPRRSYFDQGIVSGEFPIGSQREYIYRANPYVGIPGNVIQGRWRENEEWEAVAGYHNRDSARVAVSTKPYTWPATGWPVRDAQGNPVFVSDEDTYCVYSDSNNTVSRLGIQINQTGYAFSYKSVRNLIVFIYQIVNRSTTTYPDLYFGMYADCDVGNTVGEGTDEWVDDRIGFDKSLELVYYYDDGYTADWAGGRTGYFGVTFLQTPAVNDSQLGITDWHNFMLEDDIDKDALEYAIMTSSDSLYRSPDGFRYFHVGPNPTSLHYDDPSIIPPEGYQDVAFLSSGPYTLNGGDTLTFVTAFVAGNTEAELKAVTRRAFDLVADGYLTPKPPPSPNVSALEGDRRATITWDNLPESARDPVTGYMDFEGYRLYKSTDRGQHWDQFDRNQFPELGATPVPLGEFDKGNGIGEDKGLQYLFVDSSLVNGFEYWYSVTAYDAGDSVNESLESPRGNTVDEPNVVKVIPRSAAVGRIPVGNTAVAHEGASNAVVTVQTQDVNQAGGKAYEVLFAPASEIISGNLMSAIEVSLDSVYPRAARTYALVFISPTTYKVWDLSINRLQIRSAPYVSGQPIRFNGLRIVLTDTTTVPDFLPQAGDSVLFSVGLSMRANGIETLPLRRLSFGTTYVDSLGVLLRFDPIPPIASVQQVVGSNPLNVVAAPVDTSQIVTQTYTLTVDSVYPADATGLNYLLSVILTDAGGRRVSSDAALPSGGIVSGPGDPAAFELTITFRSDDLRPTVGTKVEIKTVGQIPLTYADHYSFQTTAAGEDAVTIASGLERIKVVPNPYIVSSLYEEEFGASRREPIRQLKFNNLPSRCTITIFTMDGDRIKTIHHESDNGTETWDMRGDGGREIASGVYIYLVQTDAGERIDRFAVIK